MIRSTQTVSTNAGQLLRFCEEHGLPFWLPWGHVLIGWAQWGSGQREPGLQLMQRGIDEFRASGAGYFSSVYLCSFAEICMRSGKLALAADTLDAAKAVIDQERFWSAEVHRLEGELLLIRNDEDEQAVQSRFTQALNVSRSIGAKLLELRAATNLARLWRDQRKRQQANDLLSPVYSAFTEGFDTADLSEANALLQELS